MQITSRGTETLTSAQLMASKSALFWKYINLLPISVVGGKHHALTDRESCKLSLEKNIVRLDVTRD